MRLADPLSAFSAGDQPQTAELTNAEVAKPFLGAPTSVGTLGTADFSPPDEQEQRHPDLRGAIAIAISHSVDYLMTWNCKHIANPEPQRRIMDHLSEEGKFPSFICTPEELLGEEDGN